MNENKKSSLLIVDDEQINLMALSTILSAEYEIFTADSGINAIEKAKETQPDVILLDIVMPDMDGYAVITELKKDEKTKDIPIIFITGLNSVDDEKKGLVLGASDYITKPFSPSIVKLRIQHQIKIVRQIQATNNDVEKQLIEMCLEAGMDNDRVKSLDKELFVEILKEYFSVE